VIKERNNEEVSKIKQDSEISEASSAS